MVPVAVVAVLEPLLVLARQLVERRAVGGGHRAVRLRRLARRGIAVGVVERIVDRAPPLRQRYPHARPTAVRRRRRGREARDPLCARLVAVCARVRHVAVESVVPVRAHAIAHAVAHAAVAVGVHVRRVGAVAIAARRGVEGHAAGVSVLLVVIPVRTVRDAATERERVEVEVAAHRDLPGEAPLGAVPVVFDRVVGAAGQEFGDLGPTVTEHCVGLEKYLLLLLGPRVLTDGRVQLVVPALAALLAGPSIELIPDKAPVFGTVLLHQLRHQEVLLGRPLAHDAPRFLRHRPGRCPTRGATLAS
mmetsp:Transcript_55587/g.153398  ORF Transcript_55587/g.153398 Transcript_55587/m.153398 type:complete len:304 (+) Transcript_55587:942-1853(+)